MKRGFTLLEVMLAVGIFALVSMALLRIASGALKNHHELEDKIIAGMIADNQTALLYLMSPAQRAFRHQGVFEADGRRWHWQTLPVMTGSSLIQAITVEISLTSDYSRVIQSRRAWFSATETLEVMP